MDESKRDWSLVVFGIILVVCGFAVGLMPNITLVTIAVFVGVLFVIAGIGGAISYFGMRETNVSGWYLAYAILDVVIGVMILAHLALSMTVIPWLVGACFVVLGVFQLAYAIAARKLGVSVWGWLALSGVIDVGFGALFFVMPQLLALWLAMVIIFRGISMLVSGVMANK